MKTITGMVSELLCVQKYVEYSYDKICLYSGKQLSGFQADIKTKIGMLVSQLDKLNEDVGELEDKFYYKRTTLNEKDILYRMKMLCRDIRGLDFDVKSNKQKLIDLFEKLKEEFDNLLGEMTLKMEKMHVYFPINTAEDILNQSVNKSINFCLLKYDLSGSTALLRNNADEGKKIIRKLRTGIEIIALKYGGLSFKEGGDGIAYLFINKYLDIYDDSYKKKCLKAAIEMQSFIKASNTIFRKSHTAGVNEVAIRIFIDILIDFRKDIYDHSNGAILSLKLSESFKLEKENILKNCIVFTKKYETISGCLSRLYPYQYIGPFQLEIKSGATQEIFDCYALYVIPCRSIDDFGATGINCKPVDTITKPPSPELSVTPPTS